MSPFKSKAQMKAAFGGYLGAEMKSKAEGWAQETPNPKRLPEHVRPVPRARGRSERHSSGRRGR